MATATPLYRVPVVIFAVLVGGLFVYAKSGGALFRSRTHVTPAAATPGDELGAPSIDFMMGPKSAPAFEVERPSPPSVSPPNRALVLPGSKSAGVVAPQDIVPLPGQSQSTNVSPPARPHVLPGSKSMIVIPPESLQPANDSQRPAAPRNSP